MKNYAKVVEVQKISDRAVGTVLAVETVRLNGVSKSQSGEIIYGKKSIPKMT